MESGGVRRRACARCHAEKDRCVPGCQYAPYFPANQPEKYNTVRKLFSVHKIMNMLQELPWDQRAAAMDSIVYEAGARERNPIYGCLSEILALKQQVQSLENQLKALSQMLSNQQMVSIGEVGEAQTLQGQPTALPGHVQMLWGQGMALPGEVQMLESQPMAPIMPRSHAGGGPVSLQPKPGQPQQQRVDLLK